MMNRAAMEMLRLAVTSLNVTTSTTPALNERGRTDQSNFFRAATFSFAASSLGSFSATSALASASRVFAFSSSASPSASSCSPWAFLFSSSCWPA